MSTLFENLTPGQFTPKYVGLARDLLCDISARSLGEGDRLPTENEIASQYALSRVTVRQALDLLEQEGIISRERARGTFVRKPVNRLEQFGIVRGTVLLVCSNEQREHMSEDTAFAQVLCAVEQGLADQGFVVQLAALGRSPEEDRERIRRAAASPDLAGIAVIGPFLEPYRDLFGPTPIVTLGTFHPTAPPWIGVDIATAARQSIAYLLGRGHRRVALACGGSPDPDVLRPFLAGYKRAHDQAGVAWDRSLVFHAHPDEPLDELADHALAAAPRATAVFADNWQACRAILRAAVRKGLRIPDDLSVMSYGVNILGITSPVAITAHVPDYAQVGQSAARLLAELVSGRPESMRLLHIPSQLVERDSVGDVPITA